MDKVFQLNDTLELLKEVKKGEDAFLKALYMEYKAKYVSWFLKNHQLDMEETLELYQNSFTIFYFNVKDGKIKELKSSVETYLFGIGKNLVRERVRKDSRSTTLDNIPEVEFMDFDYFKKHDKTHEQHLVRKILEALGEPCRSILSMYYFKEFSMDIIAERLGYKNSMVAKKKKYQCMKKIREELLSKK